MPPLKIIFEVPANVRLPDGIELSTGKQQADITANFDRCVPGGCFAATDIDAKKITELSHLKKNGKLQFKNAGWPSSIMHSGSMLGL